MFLPMFKTVLFLLIIWCCYFCRSHGCLEEERTHLLQIKDSINYPHGSSLFEDWVFEDWVGKNCCNWSRIECNSSSSRVISIDLSSIRDEILMGLWYPNERFGLWYPNVSLFAAFKELEELRLEGNYIGGWVAPQGLCELKNLRDLELDDNNLDGRALPPCLSNLSMLETLSLAFNDLGSYSSALTGLCGLRALRSLNLNGNNFNDSNLPRCMGNFSSLENLYLSSNNLSGHFGNSISGLKRLQVLFLESNQLTDYGISRWIPNLPSLTLLSLEDNKLKGSDTMRGLCGLSALTSLYLKNNYLSSLPICMGDFPLLEELDLSRNNLSILFGNSISGLKRLQKLHLESNQLTDNGISPWISNLTSLTFLNLGHNKLQGSNTMRGLCGLSALKSLYLYDNHLSSLPMCMGNFSILEELYLFQNNLSGLFGSAVPGLKKLEWLDLDSNHLTDEGISPWISNLTSLTLLSLENNTLKDSGTIRGLKRLQQLHLGSNQLTDEDISPWIYNLTSLIELNLGNNKLKGSDTMRGTMLWKRITCVETCLDQTGNPLPHAFYFVRKHV